MLEGADVRAVGRGSHRISLRSFTVDVFVVPSLSVSLCLSLSDAPVPLLTENSLRGRARGSSWTSLPSSPVFSPTHTHATLSLPPRKGRQRRARVGGQGKGSAAHAVTPASGSLSNGFGPPNSNSPDTERPNRARRGRPREGAGREAVLPSTSCSSQRRWILRGRSLLSLHPLPTNQ